MVGVNPTDVFEGHDVDGIDIWPMITGENLTNPREFLPVTEQSIIWKQQWKFFSSSDSPFGRSGWSYPNGTLMDMAAGVAATCTNCLFDILHDENETMDVSAAHPDIVAKLSAQLKSYRYYTNASMTSAELEDYGALPQNPKSTYQPGCFV